MQVVSKFTYTLETIIQAGKMLVAIDHVPIADEPEDCASRGCSRRCGPTSAATRLDLPHLREYEPLRVFMTAAIAVGLVAAVVVGPLRVLLDLGRRRAATCSR